MYILVYMIYIHGIDGSSCANMDWGYDERCLVRQRIYRLAFYTNSDRIYLHRAGMAKTELQCLDSWDRKSDERTWARDLRNYGGS